MTVAEFIQQNQLTAADVKSTTKCYDNSNDEIKFVKIAPAVNKQDTVVLSHNAALAATTKDEFLALEMAYDEDFGWGIIRPSATTLLCSLL